MRYPHFNHLKFLAGVCCAEHVIRDENGRTGMTSSLLIQNDEYSPEN